MAADGRHYVNRKATPIRRVDGDAFTRQDIQHDFLHHLFADPHRVFTEITTAAPPRLITFGQLYIGTLLRSSKCSKALREKMIDSPVFATDFAKLAFLANVGRINSTQAFFPEMRTALRTYHPIPSLQHSDGNLQDAPRIKSCLKGCALPHELDGSAPSSLDDIIALEKSGKLPTTNVVNLVFVLSNHSADVAARHFPDSLRLDLLDFFLPCPVTSAARAKTFLWLMHHYLEGGPENPYDDDYSATHPGRSPYIYRVESHILAQENIDTLAEMTWGQEMAARRAKFIEKQMEVDTKDNKLPLEWPAPASEKSTTGASVSRNTPYDRAVPPQGRYNGPLPDIVYHDYQSEYGSRSEQVSSSDMLSYAWRTNFSRDLLLDSDGEDADEAIRSEYEQRLMVLRRISGHANEAAIFAG